MSRNQNNLFAACLALAAQGVAGPKQPKLRHPSGDWTIMASPHLNQPKPYGKQSRRERRAGRA